MKRGNYEVTNPSTKSNLEAAGNGNTLIRLDLSAMQLNVHFLSQKTVKHN